MEIQRYSLLNIIAKWSGGLARFEGDVTDKKGQLSYSWDVPKNSEKGTYEAKILAIFSSNWCSLRYDVNPVHITRTRKHDK